MIEVSLLEHLSQVAGAQVSRQRLLFKIKIMVFGFAVMRVSGRIELLAFDDLFLDEASAGGVSRDGDSLGFRSGLFVLLLAEAEEAKAGGRGAVNAVGCGGAGGGLFGLGFFIFQGFRNGRMARLKCGCGLVLIIAGLFFDDRLLRIFPALGRSLFCRSRMRVGRGFGRLLELILIEGIFLDQVVLLGFGGQHFRRGFNLWL